LKNYIVISLIWEDDINKNWIYVSELLNMVMENLDDCKNKICEESTKYLEEI
jgi:hypothetical protein